LVWVFIGLSAVGFVLSLWIHFGAVAGRRVAPAEFFWILHIGIFAVWFPAVMVAQRQAGNLKRKDFWKIVLKGTPDWVRYLVYGFLGYIQQHAKTAKEFAVSTGTQFKQLRISALVVVSQ
jgi:hypothetical protein